MREEQKFFVKKLPQSGDKDIQALAVNFLKRHWLLLIILVLALFVRLWGIDHGLPFIYHPDEPALVRSAYGLRFGNLNPGHFDWPHFHFYFCLLIFEGFIKLRALVQLLHLRPAVESGIPLLWQDPAIFYFLARLVAASMGTATVGLTYLIGKRLFDRRVGLLAALFLAVSPLHVDQSHYALLDVPLTFWVALSFYFSILVMESGRLRHYLLAGLLAGFSASTKYNGALVVLAIVAAHLLRRSSEIKKAGAGVRRFLLAIIYDWWKLVLAGAVSILGFLIGTPYALLDRKTFLFKEDARGFLWQLQGMKSHVGAEALNGWWFHFSDSLKNGLGLGILILVVLGVVLVLIRRQRAQLFLLLFPVLYFLYVGSWRVVYSRFMIPILPMLCILAVLPVGYVWQKLTRRSGRVWFWGTIVLTAFTVGSLLPSLRQVIYGDRLLGQTDTRTVAKVWIDENIPDKSKIAEDTIYGYFLDPFYLPSLRISRGMDDPEKGFFIYPWSKISEVSPHENPEKFLADWQVKGVNYLVVSSLVYGRYFSATTQKLRPGVVETQADYRWFDENFELVYRINPKGRPGPEIKVYRVTY